MNSESATSLTTIHSDDPSLHQSHCAHTHPSGRRCRMPAAPGSFPFCLQHAAFRPDDPDSLNLVPDLVGKRRKLTSASQMQRALGKLFLLLAEGRITPKRASVLTYIVQQLLRTLPEIEREQGLDQDRPISLEGLPYPIPGYRGDDTYPSPDISPAQNSEPHP